MLRDYFDHIHVIQSKISHVKSGRIMITSLLHPRVKCEKFKVGANDIEIITVPNPVFWRLAKIV